MPQLFSNLVSPNLSLDVPTIPNRTHILLPCIFAPEKVEKFLETLDCDSATVADGFSACVLKTCSAALAYPISALFSQSFAQGHIHLFESQPKSLHYINENGT